MESFGRCYEIFSQLNDPISLHAAQVQYGMAKGHQRIQSYSTDIVKSCRDDDSLERMLEWKCQLTVSEKNKDGTTKENDEPNRENEEK